MFSTHFIVFTMFMLYVGLFYAWYLSALIYGRIYLDKKVFLGLVSSENKTKVRIFLIKRWKNHLYIANVDGNHIYTTSLEPLEFPDSCELILTTQRKLF